MDLFGFLRDKIGGVRTNLNRLLGGDRAYNVRAAKGEVAGPVNPKYKDLIKQDQARRAVLSPSPRGGRNFGAASAILDAGLKQAQAILAGVPKLKAFDYDKALAKATKLATSQANKFYTEKLENFMEGVDIERSQSAETEQRLITTLNAQSDRFLGKEKQSFEIAKDNALQGFAATSTQTSPLTRGKLGQEEAVFERGISDFLSGVEERRGGLLEGGRQFLERSRFGEKIGKADIAREKKLDIQTGIAGGITSAIQRQGVQDRAQQQAFQTALGKASIINQSALSRAFGAL